MMSKPDPIRIVVLGDTAMGKTALIVKLISGRFIWNYDPTMEGTYKHTLCGNKDEEGDNYLIEVMDTAGTITTEAQQIKRDSYIKWADGFILIYSITDRKSFESVKSLRDHIFEIKKIGEATVTIIANKTDLDHQRTVAVSEGEKMADELGCSFSEISVRTDRFEIIQPFLALCRDIKMKKLRDATKLRRRSSASQMLRKLIQKKLSI